jgi:hypothetical protein
MVLTVTLGARRSADRAAKTHSAGAASTGAPRPVGLPLCAALARAAAIALVLAAPAGCKSNEVDSSTTNVNGRCTGAFQHCTDGPADRCETNTELDVAHCGACGQACSAVHGKPTCTAALCAIACDDGFADCNGDVADGCEADLGSSVASCGACGVACGGGDPVCDAGVCRTACADGPTDLATDVRNCGACGHACSTEHGTASCSGGACAITCDAGFGDCDGDVTDGCETSVASTVTDCGACGNACSAAHGTPSCRLGACGVVCEPGFADCGGANDGCETPLSTLADCAACGDACAFAHGTASCDAGVCSLVACEGGFHACAGACVADADATACGAQCVPCVAPPHAVPTCEAGACGWTCAAGFADCDGLPEDGCEVSTADDPRHCGACGVDCLQGACKAATCQPAVLATALVEARSLAAEGGEVCWREAASMRCMIAAGGAPHTIDAGADASNLSGQIVHLSQGSYYWLGADGLYRVPRAGGPASQLFALTNDVYTNETPRSVAGVGDDVFASLIHYEHDNEGGHWVRTRVMHASPAGVVTKLIEGGVLDLSEPAPGELAARGDKLAYWAYSGAAVAAYVTTWTAPSPQPVLMHSVASAPGMTRPLALDDTYLYKHAEFTGRLERRHLVGLKATDVTASCNSGAFVVWPGNVACTHDASLRWVRGADDTQIYAGAGDIVSLAMDASALYWLEADPQTGLFRLLQLAKPAP